MLKSLLKPSLMMFLCCLFTTSSVNAVEVSKLDEADVPVASRGNADRSQAMKAALEKVIVKNSGTMSVLSNGLIRSQLSHPDALLSQYGYLESDGQLQLRASFEHKRVIALLRQAQLPVWGTQRPVTLFWLALPSEAETVILSDSAVSAERKAFSNFSNDRGIPLLLPILDLDEQMGVNPNDVKGMFADVMSSVSGRYQADFMALGAIEPDGSQFKYRLNLYTKATIDSLTPPLFTYNGSAETSDKAVNGMLAALGEYYFTKYAIADTGAAVGATVTFMNINQMSQLVEIEKYLQQLSAVKTVKLSQIKGQTVTFGLDLFSSESDLQRLLSLEPKISIIDSFSPTEFTPSHGIASPTAKPMYQWRAQ